MVTDIVFYCSFFFRITNAFVRRDRDVTQAETIRKVDCETENTLPSTIPAGRLSRKDIFEDQKLKEIPSRRDLFEAIEEHCKFTWIGNQQNVIRAVMSHVSLLTYASSI